MRTNEIKLSRRVPPRRVGRMIETVVGCKWSLTVIDLVQRDIRRPGAMERTVEGLTAKVLNDCLRLLVSYGIFEKQSFLEVPPRVEYRFTAFGRKFVDTLTMLDTLEVGLARAKRRAASRGPTALGYTGMKATADETSARTKRTFDLLVTRQEEPSTATSRN
jgi:DNA-binding HxlR family transcriptional regulator